MKRRLTKLTAAGLAVLALTGWSAGGGFRGAAGSEEC